jgi:anti-sigma factor RsiW
MTHLTEEELVLHYYGDAAESLTAERHLEDCPECRDLYASIERVLYAVDAMPVPERSQDYGAEVWRRISPAIPRRRSFFAGWLPSLEWRWAAAGVAMAGLLVVAFYAGRNYPQQGRQSGSRPATAVTAASSNDPQVRERVLLVAVGAYLERSHMVLSELANADAKGKIDISAQQERAADLVSESRLYRQTAELTGDSAVAGTLDEIDRVLLDIAHGPPEVSRAELESLRSRLNSEGILFKIRVLGSKVRTEQINDAAPGANSGRRAL